MNDLDRAIKYYETAKVKNIHIDGATIINMPNLLRSLKISGWIKAEDRLPEHGQEIAGFVYRKSGELGAHGVWDEMWDKDEPVGRMTHWIPIPE